MILYDSHRLSHPLLQYSQIPQLTPGAIKTFSPLECPLTRLPTSAISPEMSEPDMCGRGILSLLVPPLAQISRWFSPHALTLTRTSVGWIFGSGASSNRTFSGPPNSWNRTAFNFSQSFLQEAQCFKLLRA